MWQKLKFSRAVDVSRHGVDTTVNEVFSSDNNTPRIGAWQPGGAGRQLIAPTVVTNHCALCVHAELPQWNCFGAVSVTWEETSEV